LEKKAGRWSLDSNQRSESSFLIQLTAANPRDFYRLPINIFAVPDGYNFNLFLFIYIFMPWDAAYLFEFTE
jgi:hypothetical protein